MTPTHYPNMTRDELMHLFNQLGTWRAVAKHLGLSTSGLNSLKRKLRAGGKQTDRYRKRPSVLDPYRDQIAELAAQGYHCGEIVEKLKLPVQNEQLRRFLHKRGIPLLARQGAQPGEKHRDWKGGRTKDKDG